MSSDKRLVYSTEQGQLGKAMDKASGRGKGKHKKQATPPAAIKNPGKQGVRIQRESKGRGGKSVSVIFGLGLPADKLKELCKKLKAGLGTGGAVKGDTIEIQGDHREKILAALEKEGIKAKLAGG